MRTRARRARVLAAFLGLVLGACASASDVQERAAALAPTIDPTTRGANGYCPARELAFAAAELAFAHAAADRADPGAAAQHLNAAERWALAAEAKASACVVAAPIACVPTNARRLFKMAYILGASETSAEAYSSTPHKRASAATTEIGHFQQPAPGESP